MRIKPGLPDLRPVSLPVFLASAAQAWRDFGFGPSLGALATDHLGAHLLTLAGSCHGMKVRILVQRFCFVCFVVAALWLPSSAQASSLPTFHGETGQFVEVVPKRTAPNITFADSSGNRLQLSEFRGKAVLVNIWATWCAPCVREMPALERLQEDLGGSSFDVLAISIDAAGVTAVQPFFRAMSIDGLAIYLDPDQRSIFTKTTPTNNTALPLYGLPMNFFIDRDGILVGYLVGAANWDAEEPRSFVRHLRSWRD